MTSGTNLRSLFHPGTGAMPPYLAGRGREQEFFNERILDLAEGRQIDEDMIVYGPRGNGKTVLLRYLLKNIREEHRTVSSTWMTPDEITTPQGLLAEIVATGGLKVKKVGGGIDLKLFNVSVELENGDVLNATQLIEKRCAKTPWVLIVDEAHMLKPEVAQILLNASQKVRNGGGAFFLVLAGTPGLRNQISKAGASFWSRSNKFPVTRLSPKASVEALVKPLQDFGITFAPDVVEDVVMRAQRYPFFLQLWGQALCRQIKPGDVIDAGHVQTVEATVSAKRDMMYVDRYNELRNVGYLDIAQHLTQLFIEKGPVIREAELRDEVETVCAQKGKNGLETLLGLEDLGYIWQAHSNPLAYEAGIPSLMSYVADQLQMTIGQRRMRIPPVMGVGD